MINLFSISLYTFIILSAIDKVSAMQQYYLEKMGITSWLIRANSPPSPTLQQVAAEVSSCQRCPLHAQRTQTVFARGNPQASLMIIGEAPGFHEDQQGLPFVGAAGSLLDLMIASVGIQQDNIYIANVLKCRPPNNRDPKPEEITHCSTYLAQQIMLVQPKLIVALGRFAAQYLLNTTQSLSQMRTRLHQHHSIPVIVTYHPAYLLRTPKDKKRAYQDWLTIQSSLSRTEN